MRRALTLLAVLAAGEAGAQETRLSLDAAPGEVRLSWTLAAWSADLQGFVVQRRASSSTPWQRVHAGVIRPGLDAAKDLGPVEPDPARQVILVRDFATMAAAGKLKSVTEQDFVRTVSARPEVLAALGREILSDHRRALLIGLGCVDRKPLASGEYGLFAQTAAGVGATPLATTALAGFVRDDARLRAVGLTARGNETTVALSWKYREADAAQFGISGFHVYREGKRITSEPVPAARVQDAHLLWLFVDRQADPAAVQRYEVAPVNRLGSELPSRTAVNWEHKAEAAPPALRLDRAAQSDSGAVELAWTIEGEATSFQLERMKLPDGAFAGVGQRLSGTRRSAQDPDAPPGAHAYRVAAETPNGRAISGLQVVVIGERARLAAPRGLAAEAMRKGDDTLLHVRWEAVEGAAGYLLFADRSAAGRLDRLGSTGLVTGTEADVAIPLLKGRTLTVAAAAVSHEGLAGEKAQVRVLAPGAMVEPPGSPRVLRKDAALILQWDYPATEPVSGFRVAVDGRPAASEAELGPSLRAFRLADVQPRATVFFEVVAVAPGGEASEPSSISFVVPR